MGWRPSGRCHVRILKRYPARVGSRPATDPVHLVASAMLAHYAPKRPRPRRWATPGRLAVTLDKGTVQTPALDLIDAELVRLADAPGRQKLIICMPPQEGKSERVSHYFPPWLLDQNHDLRIAIVSYADEMARRWGSAIKRDAETYGAASVVDLELRLREDSRAAGRWQLIDGQGGVYCVGIAGSLSGKPVDMLIIDDPIKDLAQAQSTIYRQRFVDFYQAVAVPRLAPDAKIVLITTRWHEEDAAGWLQINEPGQWRVVSIPAVAESDDDPLGRPIGQGMVSARGDRDWADIEATVGPYVWAALYQQRPAPAAGGLFKRRHLRYWHWLPPDPFRHDAMNGMRIDVGGQICYLADCWRFTTVDLAASTRTSADFTAAGVWCITLTGDLVLLDGQQARIGETEHWDMIRPLHERWVGDVVFVESRMFGTTLVIQGTQAGVPMSELHADTDKLTRALPASARAAAGRLFFPAADTSTLCVRDLVDQLVAFPNAAHDDLVDMISYAARVVIAHWRGGQQYQRELPSERRALTDADRAYEAHTGKDPILQVEPVNMEY
jgi:predicted phage terminase large subunit-like protein